MPLVFILSIAEIAAVTSFGVFPALVPHFQAEWGLTNTQTGWISGIYFAGYVAAVPFLVSLTDQRDARGIFLGATALTVVSELGFAALANGFESALAFRILAGVGLAGTYMPGLRVLTDRLDDASRPRAIAFYTASFGIGTSLSYAASAMLAEQFGWQVAFVAAACGAALAFALVALAVGPKPPQSAEAVTGALLDFRPVLRCRAAMAYVLAYTAHSWELFGFRAWIVAYLAYCQSLRGVEDRGESGLIAAVLILVGMPASVAGNEFSRRHGRRRVVTAIMLTSALTALALGFGSALPFWVVILIALVYGVLVTGDSASITSGAVAAAPPGRQGATMAVHSTLGFSGGIAGPLVMGWVLDRAGAGFLGWGLAFASLAAACAMGPLALALLASADRPNR
ncbi:MAG: MFS transporter [Alphaproteobacteria bacterium]